MAEMKINVEDILKEWGDMADTQSRDFIKPQGCDRIAAAERFAVNHRIYNEWFG